MVVTGDGPIQVGRLSNGTITDIYRSCYIAPAFTPGALFACSTSHDHNLQPQKSSDAFYDSLEKVVNELRSTVRLGQYIHPTECLADRPSL